MRLCIVCGVGVIFEENLFDKYTCGKVRCIDKIATSIVNKTKKNTPKPQNQPYFDKVNLIKLIIKDISLIEEEIDLLQKTLSDKRNLSVDNDILNSYSNTYKEQIPLATINNIEHTIFMSDLGKLDHLLPFDIKCEKICQSLTMRFVYTIKCYVECSGMY